MLNLGIAGGVIGVKGGEDAENVSAGVQGRGEEGKERRGLDGQWFGDRNCNCSLKSMTLQVMRKRIIARAAEETRPPRGLMHSMRCCPRISNCLYDTRHDVAGSFC